MASTITMARSVCGTLGTSSISIYAVHGETRIRIAAARFTNIGTNTAYLSIRLKNASLQFVALCPNALNLDPGCTLELVEPQEELWLYRDDAIYANTLGSAEVQYIIFFGGS